MSITTTEAPRKAGRPLPTGGIGVEIDGNVLRAATSRAGGGFDFTQVIGTSAAEAFERWWAQTKPREPVMVVWSGSDATVRPVRIPDLPDDAVRGALASAASRMAGAGISVEPESLCARLAPRTEGGDSSRVAGVGTLDRPAQVAALKQAVESHNARLTLPAFVLEPGVAHLCVGWAAAEMYFFDSTVPAFNRTLECGGLDAVARQLADSDGRGGRERVQSVMKGLGDADREATSLLDTYITKLANAAGDSVRFWESRGGSDSVALHGPGGAITTLRQRLEDLKLRPIPNPHFGSGSGVGSPAAIEASLAVSAAMSNLPPLSVFSPASAKSAVSLTRLPRWARLAAVGVVAAVVAIATPLYLGSRALSQANSGLSDAQRTFAPLENDYAVGHYNRSTQALISSLRQVGAPYDVAANSVISAMPAGVSVTNLTLQPGGNGLAVIVEASTGLGNYPSIVTAIGNVTAEGATSVFSKQSQVSGPSMTFDLEFNMASSGLKAAH